MIRLNQHIKRWRRHRLVGPLLVLLVVVVVALVAIHEGHESVDADVGVLCVGLVFILLAAVNTFLRRPLGLDLIIVLPSRGPPPRPANHPSLILSVPRCLPLRL